MASFFVWPLLRTDWKSCWACGSQRKLASRKTTARRPEGRAPAVYGDAAYGSGELLAYLDKAGIDPRVKVQQPIAPGGLFPKDRFKVDVAAGTVTCPAGNTAAISFGKAGDGTACFRDACSNCPLRQSCTTAAPVWMWRRPWEARLVLARGWGWSWSRC